MRDLAYAAGTRDGGVKVKKQRTADCVIGEANARGPLLFALIKRKANLLSSVKESYLNCNVVESRPTPVRGAEPDWTAIEQSSEFQSLVRAKMRFVVPATVFFVAYYFALPILVGYFPGVMERKVSGNINVAYLFALSEFAMAWTIMALYVRNARATDIAEQRMLNDLKDGGLR
jgi:uncharacterized membrane protein (DUF485 family)